MDTISLDRNGAASTLLVIGAGPKGIAIAGKREALCALGRDVARVVVVDRDGVAAGWSGEHGFTDGNRLLGTPPEKDIGFPYGSDVWGSSGIRIDAEMTSLSWHRFLISEGAYATWVDRGRPRPTHRIWSAYLRWVAERINLELRREDIRSIAVRDGRWILSCHGGTHRPEYELEGDALVLTGPGSPIHVAGQPKDHPRVLDGHSFWQQVDMLAELRSPVSVGVVGSGETAAAVVVALLDLLYGDSSIEIISPNGVPFSRGESFEESRLFSNPGSEWERLSVHHRREFVRRTDRGVFSMQAQEQIDQAENVRTLAGQVIRVDARDENVLVDVRYGDETERVAYDYVVIAIGFDPLSFVSLLEPETRRRLGENTEGWSRSHIELSIGFDLSVEGIDPPLHLPMMAGVAQGPGFPNLSCLGLLSDRILSSYTEPRPEIVAERVADHAVS
ncbi:MAG TPA: SidA/IucD/PvdA family monooxygenase [Chloroflexota bacterium]